MDNHGGMNRQSENSRFVNQSSLEILPAEPSGSKLEKRAKEMMNLTLRSILVHASQVIFTCRKILRLEASGFTSSLKEG
jgi:hypothetical protein